MNQHINLTATDKLSPIHSRMTIKTATALSTADMHYQLGLGLAQQMSQDDQYFIGNAFSDPEEFGEFMKDTLELLIGNQDFKVFPAAEGNVVVNQDLPVVSLDTIVNFNKLFNGLQDSLTEDLNIWASPDNLLPTNDEIQRLHDDYANLAHQLTELHNSDIIPKLVGQLRAMQLASKGRLK